MTRVKKPSGVEWLSARISAYGGHLTLSWACQLATKAGYDRSLPRTLIQRFPERFQVVDGRVSLVEASTDEQRAAALGRLHAAIGNCINSGRRVPCIGRQEWTSSDPDDQQAAAEACGHCPALLACARYRDQWDETGAVYAGQLPTPTPARKGTRRKRDAA